MAYTATRTIEVHRADLADLTTVNSLPVLRVQGKGSADKDDMVVITSTQAQEALYDYLADRGKDSGALFISLSRRSHGQRLGLRANRGLVKYYYRRAGVVDPRITAYSLRHSTISKVTRRDLLKARQIARHVSIDTTIIYTHEADRLDNPGESFIAYNGNRDK
jgi:integrase